MPHRRVNSTSQMIFFTKNSETGLVRNIRQEHRRGKLDTRVQKEAEIGAQYLSRRVAEATGERS